MKELGYDSKEVLPYIIKKCMELSYSVNLTKAQKLLFCCYGVCLAKFDVRLTKEHPKAWTYGPIFPRAYEAHKEGLLDFEAIDPISKIDPQSEMRYMIDETIKHFGQYSATQLTNWTHKEGSPWYISSNNGEVLYNRISDALIQIYFKSILADEDEPENKED